MNFIVEHLNAWGPPAVAFGWAMLWQSSLLILLLLAVEGCLGRKLRPGLRYVLWLFVLLKLLLPPSFALPTGVAWWVRPKAHRAAETVSQRVLVTYGPAVAPVVRETAVLPEMPGRSLSTEGGFLAASALVSFGLLVFIAWRWRQVVKQAGRAHEQNAAESLKALLEENRRLAGVRRAVALRVVSGTMSPALFGLFKPVILLPERLAKRFSAVQLRSVLLHELIHLRRADVWVNCAQALLQIVYWWHPLVWLANHRIRRAREEAVDEAVMLALREEAGHYAPTLVEVARLAWGRPLASLGLVGILEAHGALRERIERLVDFRPPGRAAVTLRALVCAGLFGAVALPMGQAPGQNAATNGPEQISPGQPKPAPARVLVEDGKLLYEMGKLDEAEKKFRQALQLEPREQSAYYYLALIKEARRKQAGEGLRNTSAGRKRVYGKLENVHLKRIEFDDVPLRDVVQTLLQQARQNDSTGEGVNFILSRATSETNQAPARDIGDVVIRLRPALVDLRLVDALDAIVKVADEPIKYTIEDYGVVFSRRGNEAPPLYNRIIRVDPNTFQSGLRSVVGQPDAMDQDTTSLLKEFLTSINVELSPPKTVFYNAREGTLFVRTTLQDLDTIETAIQVLNLAPPQLHIKAKFIEVTEAAETAFWAKHQNREPGTRGAGVQLTSEEAGRQLAEWSSTGSNELLAESSVTTLSGRQCEIQVVQPKPVATFTNWPQAHWETNAFAAGPVLDVLPTLSADRWTVDLALKPVLNEFLGYETTGFGTPSPRFRTRKLDLHATVRDRQTLVVGSFHNEQDQPADNPGDGNKRLLMFITPTVIDPVGNPVHAEKLMNGSSGPVRLWYPTIPPRPVK